MNKEQNEDNRLDNKTAELVIEHAARELEVKRHELVVMEKKEDTKRFEIEENAKIAHAQIAAQAADLQDNRRQYNQMLEKRYWFYGVITLFLLLFAAFAIHSGAKDIVIETVKAIGFLVAGGFGGYYYGKSKKDPS